MVAFDDIDIGETALTEAIGEFGKGGIISVLEEFRAGDNSGFETVGVALGVGDGEEEFVVGVIKGKLRCEIFGGIDGVKGGFEGIEGRLDGLVFFRAGRFGEVISGGSNGGEFFDAARDRFAVFRSSNVRIVEIMVDIVAATIVKVVHAGFERFEGFVSGGVVDFVAEEGDNESNNNADQGNTAYGKADDERSGGFLRFWSGMRSRVFWNWDGIRSGVGF